MGREWRHRMNGRSGVSRALPWRHENSVSTVKQVPVAQHRLKRRNPGVGAQDEDPVIAGFLGDLARHRSRRHHASWC